MYTFNPEHLYNETFYQIAQFHEEARQEALLELARHNRETISENNLSIRQRLGFRLIYWGWQLAGNVRHTPEYLRELN
jgi:hypothetical protein